MRLDRPWPVIIIGYFVLQIVLRTTMGGALGLDEAQAILDSREYAWGYGPQPPLYNWLQRSVFLILGESIFSLSLLKNALLCLTYLSLYALLRTTYDRVHSGLATIALLLLPQIAWESQRALTHSVLVTFSVVVTVLVFWHLNRQRSLFWYLLFGLTVGLGCISKFNYAIIPAALLMAGLSLTETRGTVANWRLAISGLVAATILAKPALWILDNKDLALSSTQKFDVQVDHGIVSAALAGTAEFALATALFLALALVVLGLLRLRFGIKPSEETEEPALLLKLLVRLVVVATVLTFLMVIFSGTTNVKDRWLQPVLVLAAPALVLWTLPRLNETGHRRLGQIILILAIVILAALPINMLYGTPGKPSFRAAPVAGLIRQLAADFPQDKVIFSENDWLAGNIALLQPGWTILTPSRMKRDLSPPDNVIMIWSPDIGLFGRFAEAALKRNLGDSFGVGEKKTFSADYFLRSERPFTAGFALARRNGSE